MLRAAQAPPCVHDTVVHRRPAPSAEQGYRQYREAPSPEAAEPYPDDDDATVERKR